MISASDDDAATGRVRETPKLLVVLCSSFNFKLNFKNLGRFYNYTKCTTHTGSAQLFKVAGRPTTIIVLDLHICTYM